MKRAGVIIILAVFFMTACTVQSPTDPLACTTAKDCEHLEPKIDCDGVWMCSENKQCFYDCRDTDKGILLNLQAQPEVGAAPLTVNFDAYLELKGVDTEDYYCVSTTWDFGEGDPLTAMPGCTPYEKGMEIDRQFSMTYTYEKPGTYTSRFKIKDTYSRPVVITVLGDDAQTCTQDSDCVEAQCCHATGVVNKKYAPECQNVYCTESCEGPLDCGKGSPACENSKCVIKKNY